MGVMTAERKREEAARAEAERKAQAEKSFPELASLTIREAERCERSSTLGGRTIVIGRVWVHGGPSENLEGYWYKRSEIVIPDTLALTRLGIAPTLTL
jgi:hypothetical protein